MPNLASAKKRARQNIKRNTVNTARRSTIKTAIKKVLTAVENKDLGLAQELLKNVYAQVMRAKGKGLIHRNTAARKMSRLANRVNSLAKPTSAA